MDKDFRLQVIIRGPLLKGLRTYINQLSVDTDKGIYSIIARKALQKYLEESGIKIEQAEDNDIAVH